MKAGGLCYSSLLSLGWCVTQNIWFFAGLVSFVR